MQTWHKLYGAIWLNFATIMVGFTDSVPFRTEVHSVLGLAVVVLALHNRSTLAKVQCPARLHRIVTASAGMGALACITGALMMVGPSDTVMGWLLGIHLTAAMAGFAQSASVATGHDLWATRELSAPPG